MESDMAGPMSSNCPCIESLQPNIAEADSQKPFWKTFKTSSLTCVSRLKRNGWNLMAMMIGSPSYLAISCGGAPIEGIRQSIEQQQAPS